jgi:hypothetical protein
MNNNRKTLPKLLFLISILISYNVVFAQGGETAVPFLMITPAPRTTGMGETGVGIADDANAIFLNPGGLAFQKGQELSYLHSNWFGSKLHQDDLYYFYLNAKKNFEDIGTFSASLFYLNLGKYRRTIDYEIVEDEYYEYAITLGYARSFWDELGLGINLRYISSNLGKSTDDLKDIYAKDWSFDIGAFYKPQNLILPFIDLDIGKKIGFGLNLSNMGPKVEYKNLEYSQSDPLPTQIKFGIGLIPFQSEISKLIVCVDLSRPLVRRHGDNRQESDEFYKAIFTAWGDGGLKKVVFSTGLEYSFDDPEFKLFGKSFRWALRAGYLDEAEDYGNRKYYTFGMGIKYFVLGFDFSYISTVNTNSPLDGVYKFGFNVAWL